MFRNKKFAQVAMLVVLLAAALFVVAPAERVQAQSAGLQSWLRVSCLNAYWTDPPLQSGFYQVLYHNLSTNQVWSRTLGNFLPIEVDQLGVHWRLYQVSESVTWGHIFSVKYYKGYTTAISGWLPEKRATPIAVFQLNYILTTC